MPPNAPGQYAPRDECSAQPGGAEFLARLKDAAKARDAVSLALLASPKVMLDFGGGSGRDEMVRRFVPGSDLWQELDKALALGCAFDKDNSALVVPWFFAQDLGDSDPFGTSVTLGKAVPLYKAGSAKSAVLKQLNWQLVVNRDTDEIGSPFIPVAVIDSDLVGYVEMERLRSPLAYRLRAEKVDGKWQIASFLAGE